MRSEQTLPLVVSQLAAPTALSTNRVLRNTHCAPAASHAMGEHGSAAPAPSRSPVQRARQDLEAPLR